MVETFKCAKLAPAFLCSAAGKGEGKQGTRTQKETLEIVCACRVSMQEGTNKEYSALHTQIEDV